MAHKKGYIKRDSAGFTLIEVIVALTILSIALYSIILSNIELIRNIDYLRNKTIATWVASNVVNKVKIGLIQPPLVIKPIYGKTYMMHSNWYWKIGFKTLNPNQYQVNVSVFKDKNDKIKLSELMSFIRKPR